MSAMERRILLVTCLAHFLSHFNMLVFPALVLPLAAALKMPMTQVVGLSFWMYLLFGLMALPWGLTGDRWGGKRLILVMFIGAGLSGVAAGLLIDSPELFSVALAALGLFSSIYHPIGLGLISKGVNRLSVAMGYNAVFGGLGLVAAPLVTGLSVWISGPKAAFFVLAGLNFLGAVLMGFFPLDEPSREEHGSSSNETNGMLGAFLILLVAMMLGGIAYRGATVILPSYMEIRGQGIFHDLTAFLGRDLSANLVATTVTSLIYLVGMVGQFVGGHVGERFDIRYSYLVFHAICIPAVLLMSATQNVPLVLSGFVYLFFLLGMQPIENTLVARLSPRRLHHSAYGMKFILTFGVGALAVKLIQAVEAQWGIEACFVALGLISTLLVSSIAALILWTNRTERCESVNRPAYADNSAVSIK